MYSANSKVEATHLVILGQAVRQQQPNKIAKVLPLSHPWSGNSKLDVASILLNWSLMIIGQRTVMITLTKISKYLYWWTNSCKEGPVSVTPSIFAALIYRSIYFMSFESCASVSYNTFVSYLFVVPCMRFFNRTKSAPGQMWMVEKKRRQASVGRAAEARC